MELKPTDRGFLRGDFVDLDGFACSIQESSLATREALWLGVEGARMHLTPGMARALIPLLETFAQGGTLTPGKLHPSVTAS